MKDNDLYFNSIRKLTINNSTKYRVSVYYRTNSLPCDQVITSQTTTGGSNDHSGKWNDSPSILRVIVYVWFKRNGVPKCYYFLKSIMTWKWTNDIKISIQVHPVNRQHHLFYITKPNQNGELNVPFYINILHITWTENVRECINFHEIRITSQRFMVHKLWLVNIEQLRANLRCIFVVYFVMKTLPVRTATPWQYA